MARMRDAKAVIEKIGLWKFTLRIYKRIYDDNILVWASALAYSWLFAIFPFLIVTLTLVPYLPSDVKNGAEHRLHTAVMQLPGEASTAVWSAIAPIMHHVLHQPPRGLLSTGLVVMIWAASSGMSMTMFAMDKCWKVIKHRSYFRQRALAILLTIIEAALILGVLILLPVGSIVTRWIMTHISQIAEFVAANFPERFASAPRFIANHAYVVLVIWQTMRYAFALILMFLATALVYHFGPNVKRKFRWLTPGALFTVAVWLILGALFRLYVDKFGKSYEMYGTVGGVAILLLFFYIDATVLLVGSEINSEIESAMLDIKEHQSSKS